MTYDAPPTETEADPPPLRNRRRRPAPYLLLVPALLTLALGLGYPLVRQILMSFQEFGLAQQFGTAEPGWIGLDNYVHVLTDKTTWLVIARSVAFCFAAASLTMVIGMALALLMRQVSTAARIILQVSLLAAWASPLIASLTVWNWLFDTRYGVVNWLLVKVGFASFDGYSWLANPWTFFLVAGVIVVWMSVPFVAFSLYAALTQVPEETLEASQLDGASRTQRFRFIVLPTIRPVLSIVMLLQIVWDLRLFAQIKYLQGAGGTVSETNLLGTYLYQLGVAQSEYGMASAVAMLMLLLTLVLTFGYVRSLLREERAS
ncbi:MULTISPECIES: carbohydrate ABC transporter permease [Mumia]|uniref:carbohydrate ABC transporter permease n=1 Tax=Mumia TaxID=1546255 RepID=UPI0014201564|nr:MULTISPECIES: sugar ABC transporter permease [unclassified Mumia]QMW65131.1 sugar ABC transporter permease [Mumia sp. ZJ1417]